MKRILTLLLLLLYFCSRGQKLVFKGQVVDSATMIGIGATVTAMDGARTLKVAATNADGSFVLEVPAGRALLLRVTAVGYRTREVAASSDVGKIAMAAVDAALQGAVVTASKRVVKQEIDRISYDVQADPDAKANDALEMLRKVPMVTVDANDVVQLKGSSNFQIFINGKPSALMVASPSDVLKAMPAATIQKIEVITVPPSKYDGEGLAGIINIITLKSTTDGVNGSLFARYNSVFGERGSVSVNVSEGRFNLTSLLGVGRSPHLTNVAGSELTNNSPATTLSQQGDKSEAGHFNNGKVDMSYEVDSSNLLTASGDFFNRRFNQVTSTFSSLIYAPDSLVESYQLRNTGPVNASAVDGSVGYQLRFGSSKDRALNFNYRYAYTGNNQGNDVTVSDAHNYSGGDYTQSNKLQTKTHHIEAGLILPVRRLTIEAGGKAILGTNESYYSNETTVDDFSCRQNVYSVYSSFDWKLPGWEFKAGGRLENTAIGGFASRNYLNLLPTISVQRNPSVNSSVTLGFTQRIQRALAAQLNPFVDQSNPAFWVTGNPGLSPVVNNIVQLDYSRSARLSVNASADYTFSNNPIQSVTKLLSDTVSESTYENVGKNEMAGLHLTLNYPLFPKLNLILNSQLSHLWITGTYNSQFYKSDGTQGNVSASARYNAGRQLTFSLNYNYKSGNVLLQGKSSGYTYVGFNVIKEFWERRATLSITAFSPWSKVARYSVYTRTRDFVQNSYNEFYDRNFRFAFNYKFGRLKPGGARPKSDEE